MFLNNLAAARAVDREFNYKFGSNLGGREAVGAAPLLSGGLRPPDPPKAAPRPWLQRLVVFSRQGHLSGAAALPGADFFFDSSVFF